MNIYKVRDNRNGTFQLIEAKSEAAARKIAADIELSRFDVSRATAREIAMAEVDEIIWEGNDDES